MSYVTHALCTHFQTFYKSIHNTVLQLGLNDNVVMKIVGDSVKCVCSRLSDTTYAFKLVYKPLHLWNQISAKSNENKTYCETSDATVKQRNFNFKKH